MLDLLSAAAAQASQPPAWLQFLPLVAMGGVFYFLLLRPQMQKQKEHQAKIKKLAKGDVVVTGGGLVAKVIRIDGDVAELEIAPNVRVKAVLSTISDVTAPGGKPAND